MSIKRSSCSSTAPHIRRTFLNRALGGVGLIALRQLLQSQIRPLVAEGHESSSAPHSAKARSVICLFQHGGPSQIDLFDPKPTLTKLHGLPYPHAKLVIPAPSESGNLLASPFKFHPYGQSGIEISELLPNLARMVDRITLVRSMVTDSIDHESALRCFHTGRLEAGFPTWGAWIAYAIGSECENLPAHVVLADTNGLPIDGIRNWSSGWLPAIHQGTAFRIASDAPTESTVLNLQTPAHVPETARRAQLAFLERLNKHHLAAHPENDDLSARIANFEMAAKMQVSVPDFLDISQESSATFRMYGLDNPDTRDYGMRCLLARRLVEKGVRFVQVFMSGQPWDTHSDNANGLRSLCKLCDQPCAALLQDLEQRGLLDSTVVLWGGEFGRLPIAQGTDGRDHNPHGFSIWAAGGGFKTGYVHGTTDEFGYRAARDPVTVHDLHATLLHTLGLDHQALTHIRSGVPTSLTNSSVTGARVVYELLSASRSQS